MYNSFNPNEIKLVNPYFVLYNIYRGVLRIYFYFNETFNGTSTNLYDIISIDQSQLNYIPSILGYAGTLSFTKNEKYSSCSQILPAPSAGGPPLRTNRWYMSQFELAYDAQIFDSLVPIRGMLNYTSITNYEFNGNLSASIKGTVGSSESNESNSVLQFLEKTATNTAKGVIGIRAKEVNESIKATGENNLNIPQSLAKEALSGLASLATGDYSTFIKGIANMILGGNSESTAKPVDLKLGGTMKITGSGSTSGSVGDIIAWLPSSKISSNLKGIIPLYNFPLGVVNIKEVPKYVSGGSRQYSLQGQDPYDGSYYTYQQWEVFPKEINNEHCLIFNPEILKVASVKLLKEDLISINDAGNIEKAENVVIGRGDDAGCYEFGATCDPQTYYYNNNIYSRFFIEITPFNGAQSVIIVKTFKAEHSR